MVVFGITVRRVASGAVMLAVATTLSGCAAATTPRAATAPTTSGPAVPPESTKPTPSAAASPATTSTAGQSIDAAELSASFSLLASRQRGELAVTMTPVGSDAEPEEFGELSEPIAWSTIKVPIAIAADADDDESLGTMQQAITASDNDAAVELWDSLGGGTKAAAEVERVLEEFGDATTQIDLPFGETEWALDDQTRFAAQLPCRDEASDVYAAMGEIIAEQSWGLGELSDAHFKGGWGPSSSGYLVRQFGVIDTSQGQVAVAIAVEASSFEQGTATLTRTAQWLSDHVTELPAGSC